MGEARAWVVGRAVRGALGVVGLAAVAWACGRLPGVALPGAVVAMGLVFGALIALAAAQPRRAEQAARWMDPAARFLSRWMALFFVPTLVRLPVEALSWGLLWRLAVGAAAGQVLTLLSTAALLTWWAGARRGAQGVHASEDEERKEDRQEEGRGLAAMPWRWLGLWAAVAAVAAAAGWGHGAGLALAVAAYGAAEQARRVTAHAVAGWPAGARRALLGALHPVLVSGVALWLVARRGGARLGGVEASEWLLWGLAPSVASLGLLLFAQRRALRERAVQLLGVVAVAAVGSLVSSALMASWLGLRGVVAVSLLPRSVTTPIAVPITERLGGTPGLTVVVVMVAGVMGAVTGTPLLRALGFGGAWLRGVAMGASAHAMGTVSLLEDDPDAVAFSGVAFALMGALSAAALSVGPLRGWLLGWIGA
jgi:putative effector of murein hydrolase/putative effector of murein hydrolase LrgA (UPF0299 family)